MLLGLLSKLLPFDRIPSRLDVSGRLLGEDILDGQDLVKELELHLGSLLIVVWYSFSVILNKIQGRKFKYLLSSNLPLKCVRTCRWWSSAELCTRAPRYHIFKYFQRCLDTQSWIARCTSSGSCLTTQASLALWIFSVCLGSRGTL